MKDFTDTLLVCLGEQEITLHFKPFAFSALHNWPADAQVNDLGPLEQILVRVKYDSFVFYYRLQQAKCFIKTVYFMFLKSRLCFLFFLPTAKYSSQEASKTDEPKTDEIMRFIAFAPSKDSDQPAHSQSCQSRLYPPVLTIQLWLLKNAQRRL